eukprot:3639091-Rhodomonas_salina.1
MGNKITRNIGLQCLGCVREVSGDEEGREMSRRARRMHSGRRDAGWRRERASRELKVLRVLRPIRRGLARLPLP